MDKELVKILYSSGLNAAEIAEEIGAKREGVKKCIQRNFSYLKSVHVKNRREFKFQQKEALRAVNYEAKKYLSDKSFIMKNRSIYKTKANGDISLKSKNELNCSIPWDVPRSLANEAKSC